MIKKVAIFANGGEVAGFNAVIRSLVKTEENAGIESYGYIDGYKGMLNNNYIPLTTQDKASGIIHKGGSIIGSSTNTNVFKDKVVKEDGSITYEDLSEKCIIN